MGNKALETVVLTAGYNSELTVTPCSSVNTLVIIVNTREIKPLRLHLMSLLVNLTSTLRIATLLIQSCCYVGL